MEQFNKYYDKDFWTSPAKEFGKGPSLPLYEHWTLLSGLNDLRIKQINPSSNYAMSRLTEA